MSLTIPEFELSTIEMASGFLQTNERKTENRKNQLKKKMNLYRNRPGFLESNVISNNIQHASNFKFAQIEDPQFEFSNPSTGVRNISINIIN